MSQPITCYSLYNAYSTSVLLVSSIPLKKVPITTYAAGFQKGKMKPLKKINPCLPSEKPYLEPNSLWLLSSQILNSLKYAQLKQY